jgi:hypothetical protein
MRHRSKRRVSGRAGRKPVKVARVVGTEDGVAEEVCHADGHDLVKHVGRHLGVEREENDTPLHVHTGDGD